MAVESSTGENTTIKVESVNGNSTLEIFLLTNSDDPIKRNAASGISLHRLRKSQKWDVGFMRMIYCNELSVCTGLKPNRKFT